jgi:hypothetical protein
MSHEDDAVDRDGLLVAAIPERHGFSSIARVHARSEDPVGATYSPMRGRLVGPETRDRRPVFNRIVRQIYLQGVDLPGDLVLEVRRGQKAAHAGVPFAEHLVRVLRGERHGGEHLRDELVGDVLVEQVGEGVHEDLAGLLPVQRLGKAGLEEVDLAAPVDARVGALGGAGERGGDGGVRVAFADAGGADGVARVAAGADAVASDDR